MGVNMSNTLKQNLKSKALEIGPKSFNLQVLKLDRVERMNFEDFLKFKLEKDKRLSFVEFNKMCGISRKQWEVFKLENMDKEIEWKVD